MTSTSPSLSLLGEAGPSAHRRDDFLLAMYGAMWQNINRHILVVWQSVAALFTAGAAVFLSGDKSLLSSDYAYSIVVLVAAWSGAHAVDASAWFNRNLLIITNIERQFLKNSDRGEIHYFFTVAHHRRMLDHLRIQLLLAVAIGSLAIVIHLLTRILPNWPTASSTTRLAMLLPLVCGIVSIIIVACFARHTMSKESQLRCKSPGRPVQLTSTAGSPSTTNG